MSRPTMRIAVLDDDPAQMDFVCQTLGAAGHLCYVFGEGRALVKQFRRQTFDLLVLDGNVRDMSGEEVLNWVRQSVSERLPVLFVTSRSGETDITSMLNMGADDYIVKPVPAGVLLARVGALLRRAYQFDPAVTKKIFGDYEFDLNAKHVVVRGVAVRVTPKEFELALLLFQHLSRAVSRAHIREVIWKQVADIPSRTMDTHVSVLREKLGLRPGNGYRLAPVYGYGYCLQRLEQKTAWGSHHTFGLSRDKED